MAIDRETLVTYTEGFCRDSVEICNTFCSIGIQLGLVKQIDSRWGSMGMNDKLRAPADFDGPVKDRKCTDILFTLAIIALWIAMTFVGVTSIQDVSDLISRGRKLQSFQHR